MYFLFSSVCLLYIYYFVAFMIKLATDQMDTRQTVTPVRANLVVFVVVVVSPGVTVGDFWLHIAGVGVQVLGHAAVVPPLIWIT